VGELILYNYLINTFWEARTLITALILDAVYRLTSLIRNHHPPLGPS